MAEKIKILLKHFNPSKVNTTYRCICSKAYNSPHGRPQPLTDACNPIAVYLFKDNFLNFYSLNLLQTEEVWQKAIQKHFFYFDLTSPISSVTLKLPAHLGAGRAARSPLHPQNFHAKSITLKEVLCVNCPSFISAWFGRVFKG